MKEHQCVSHSTQICEKTVQALWEKEKVYLDFPEQVLQSL